MFTENVAADLFGYSAEPQPNLSDLPAWNSFSNRHRLQDMPAAPCLAAGPQGCQLYHWYQLLNSLRKRPREEQLQTVNQFANRMPYRLDQVNYGREDYWASVTQFLSRSGDCEDYALTKYLSLRYLGFPADQLKVVIVQDTSLDTPHAVLAVEQPGDTRILDNQSDQILSHHHLIHYVPLYSLNEQQWWLHIPK
ncbi:transglutaminase-like cysteine peptidase [Marinobacterium jannaschii]|uniref:transglutaminase-like cysteine peptidase n=1 Tax=Marinobacterium jannaschii TaxID=64970 RepID=UPI000A9FAD6F|nr:transglutaminase-like cysteine peptidase [Marinobacterium jannaschii]